MKILTTAALAAGLLLTGCSGDDTSCSAIRGAIERDKADVAAAGASADKERAELEADARAARSLDGCDISDLVGDGVGR